jgi:hypothetical protein
MRALISEAVGAESSVLSETALFNDTPPRDERGAGLKAEPIASRNEKAIDRCMIDGIDL